MPINEKIECLTKKSYYTAQHAINALSSMKGKGVLSKLTRLHQYKCSYCNMWHIGRKKGAVKYERFTS